MVLTCHIWSGWCRDEEVKENLNLQTPSRSLLPFSQPSAAWLCCVMAHTEGHTLVWTKAIPWLQRSPIPAEHPHFPETSKGFHHAIFSSCKFMQLIKPRGHCSCLLIKPWSTFPLWRCKRGVSSLPWGSALPGSCCSTQRGSVRCIVSCGASMMSADARKARVLFLACDWDRPGVMLGLRRPIPKTCLEGILVAPVKRSLQQNPLFSEPYAHPRVFLAHPAPASKANVVLLCQGMVDPAGAAAGFLGVDVQTAEWAVFSLFSGWFLLNPAVPWDCKVRGGQSAWQHAWQGLAVPGQPRHRPSEPASKLRLGKFMYQQVLFLFSFLKWCEPNSKWQWKWETENNEAYGTPINSCCFYFLFYFPFSLALG